MLITRHMRFFARAFINCARLTPSATNFRLVSEALGDERLLPAQVTEQSLAGSVQRIAFQDETGFQVVISADSIFAQHTPANGTLAAFLGRAANVFERLLPLLPQQATRIALIQEGSVTMARPDDVARSLFRFPPTFTAEVPFEWDWRCATKSRRSFAGRDEEMNTVATFHRIAGRLSWGEIFDGVTVELDMNTVPDNLTPRFPATDCRAFLDAGARWHDELANELVEFIRPGGPS
jgi:hypothetical protein